MNLQQVVAPAVNAVAKGAQEVSRFAKLERVLAFVCLFTPVFLIAFDGGSVRGSISAYYNMAANQYFYFPLTVAAMLFAVNGFVKHQHSYNIVLGAMLAGLILFNHDDFRTLHAVFATAFFGGNAYVIVRYSSKKERWFKLLLIAGILLAMVGWYFFDWLTLFVAEWLSFGIIALHYILESKGIID